MSKSRRSLLEFTFRAETEPGAMIPLELIHLPEQQPRRYFDPQKQDLLTESIKQHGILEPLLVRPHPDDKGKYELVAGERRYRSALAAGLGEVPVVVRQLNDQEALQVAIIENLQREDLNPIEEVEGILQILAIELEVEVGAVSSLLYRLRHSVTSSGHNVMAKAESSPSGHNVMAKQLSQVEKVFQGLGMSWKSFISNRLPLLNLPEELLQALREGKIAYTGALAIARIKDEQLRKALLSEAITEKLSLQEIKKRVRVGVGLKPTPGHSSSPEESKQQGLKKRLDHAFRRAQKVKVWDNPQKWQQIEEALDHLESLLG